MRDYARRSIEPESLADKVSYGLLPSNGETLEGYAQRLHEVASQHRNYSICHLHWHTHTGAGACWICDTLNILEFTIDSLQAICQNDALHTWRAIKNPDYDIGFTFKPQLNRKRK